MSGKRKVELVPLDRLRPHEQVDRSRIEPIMRAIKARGIRLPLLADRKEHVLLDGHHRYEALRRLKAKRAPVVLVDYESDEIILDSWRDDQVSKQEVIRRARSGDLYPVKTTKHLCMRKGRRVHLAKTLPKIAIKLEELRGKD